MRANPSRAILPQAGARVAGGARLSSGNVSASAAFHLQARGSSPSFLEVSMDSGSNTIIGVVVGALLVVAVVVWAFGGFNRREPGVSIDLPNVQITTPAPPA